MVKYLLELSENEKEYTPLTVTQTIIYIKEKAWLQVLQSTIINFWRKTDILDNKNTDFFLKNIFNFTLSGKNFEIC